MTRVVFFVAVALVSSLGCGKDKSPTAATPPIVQVGGLWAYTATLTSVGGGECVGTLFQSRIGMQSSGSMSVTQSGASVTATSTNQQTGDTCAYQGIAGTTGVVLNWTRCDANAFRVRCLNGASRDIDMVTNSIDATVSGGVATGTGVETWNVLIAGTNVGLGSMTLHSSFRATRR